MAWVTETCIRGTARELNGVMRRPMQESDVTWDTVELLIPRAELTIWSRDDGTPFPNIEEDPVDLCPERSVTKKFWKNFYLGIECLRIT
jgi:hypothetical protein